jgi:hypothetical protein
MRTFMHAEGKNQQNELENSNQKSYRIQTTLPSLGKLRLARKSLEFQA